MNITIMIKINPNSKWKDALQLKQRTRYHMTQQELTGICFDWEYGEKVYLQIDREMSELEAEVNPQLPMKKISPSKLHHPPKNQFKQDGSHSALLLKYLDKYGLSVDNVELPLKEPILTEEPMTISNQQDMKIWLQEQGWIPTLWNFKKDKRGRAVRDERGKLIKTSPKMQENGRLCPNLERLKGDLCSKVVKYLSLRNRRSVLKGMKGDSGWLLHPRLRKDGRLPAGSSGTTNTGRQKHRTVANVPKAKKKVLYGIEFRSMFKATPGYKFVGYDASQLEARCEAHVTHQYDGGAYATQILEGKKEDGTDIHTMNAQIFGCDYDTAKNGKYGLTYGCQANKLAETIGKPRSEAQRLFDDFWEANPALKKAIDATIRHWRTNGSKYILNIDGGKLYSRSEHSVFNLRLQGMGATIMDLAGDIMIGWVKILNERYPEADVRRVVYYHDELIYEYREEMGDEFGEKLGRMGCESIREAGRRLGLKIPLDGDYKLGYNWAEVH